MNNENGSIDWIKVQEEELKRKGYTQSDIDVLRNIDKLPEDILRMFLKNYIHQTAMYRDKLIRLESEE